MRWPWDREEEPIRRPRPAGHDIAERLEVVAAQLESVAAQLAARVQELRESDEF